MKKRYFLIGDFSRNVLLLSAAACLGLSACGDNRTAQNEASTEWNAGEESVPTYSQGVITEMTEISPDNWKITDERPAGAGQVMAILKHQDGKIDTLQGLDLERRMQEYGQAHPQNTAGNGLMNVLMWSGIGYMAGRMLSPNPRYYANPSVLQRNNGWYQQRERERSSGARVFGGRGYAGSYSSPTTTRRSTTGGTYRSSRPSSGRSGYFGGSSGRFGG